ncbi:hypothetical protein HYQ45_014904 [Verticillium longisporum]|uniref:Uncharacterized protein n=1 Tax=Verticillium longisporum TaxID=100787 RepID=A0A8I3ALC2_VERLO|nr:hypothetical protein HYQ45_014904 [Verticillium longisporum]
MSTQPLLGTISGQSGNRDEDRSQTGSLATFLSIFHGGLVAPDSTTLDSLQAILNESDDALRDDLTERWRDHKLQELNFVGTVGALLAACLSSTGSWPDVLDNGRKQPWSIRACWYIGLVFALFAVLTALQQSLRLHRLSAHREGLKWIRKSMTGEKTGGEVRVRTWQVYAWQASLVFLVAAVICLVAGILVLVWVSTEFGPDKKPEDGWWDDSAKMAITFTVVVVVSLVMFLLTQATLAMEGIKR